MYLQAYTLLMQFQNFDSAGVLHVACITFLALLIIHQVNDKDGVLKGMSNWVTD